MKKKKELLSNSDYQNGRRLIFLMTVGVGKPATCFRVPAGLSIPGSLGAWFESHYNPEMQVLLWEQTAMAMLCIGITLHWPCRCTCRHSHPYICTGLRLKFLILLTKSPINPGELLLNQQRYSTVNPGCKSEQRLAQMLFSHTS